MIPVMIFIYTTQSIIMMIQRGLESSNGVQGTNHHMICYYSNTTIVSSHESPYMIHQAESLCKGLQFSRNDLSFLFFGITLIMPCFCVMFSCPCSYAQLRLCTISSPSKDQNRKQNSTESPSVPGVLFLEHYFKMRKHSPLRSGRSSSSW